MFSTSGGYHDTSGDTMSTLVKFVCVLSEIQMVHCLKKELVSVKKMSSKFCHITRLFQPCLSLSSCFINIRSSLYKYSQTLLY